MHLVVHDRKTPAHWCHAFVDLHTGFVTPSHRFSFGDFLDLETEQPSAEQEFTKRK